MTKLAFKQKVLETIRAQVEREIEDLNQQIERIQESEMDKDEDQFDMDEESQDEASHEVLDKLTEQRNFALTKQQIVDSMAMPQTLLDEVAPGAIVDTNQGIFYVSVATDDFPVDGKRVRGISKEAPVYELMEGKKEGDSFSFRDTSYEIREVY